MNASYSIHTLLIDVIKSLLIERYLNKKFIHNPEVATLKRSRGTYQIQKLVQTFQHLGQCFSQYTKLVLVLQQNKVNIPEPNQVQNKPLKCKRSQLTSPVVQKYWLPSKYFFLGRVSDIILFPPNFVSRLPNQFSFHIKIK